MRVPHCLAASAALTFALMAHAQQPVRVWQGSFDIPVYAEGAPDPNPPFDAFGGAINYPYSLRQDLTGKPQPQSLRALFLENEYLKCTVLPDLGGHVYTCVDKLSGKPMFYANPSIKKARIAYRGAWAAFGIEFNFPVSHNWVSLSPVNFSMAKHDDSSASVTVSNIDRVYGMQWTVDLILQPGSAVLQERVTLSNRSDVRHRYYWWNNAGVQAWEDSRICYPAQFTASHGFTNVDTWPVTTSGKDYSVIHNQKDGTVSRFVYASREPYIGIWHPHTDTGLVHYAEYVSLPGKKFWSWGDDARGREWRNILSDNNSIYVELQAGPFRNQETYAYLEPQQNISFSEYWMPARGIGGIARANLNGVLNLSRSATTLDAALNVNIKFSDATVRILYAGKEVSSDKLDLSPEKTWKKQLPLRPGTGKYTIEVLDARGSALLSQTEGQYDWTPASEVKVGNQANFHFPSASERSADDWQGLGDEQEVNGALLEALATYTAGLQRFPKSFSLALALGRLKVSMDRYSEAVPLLETVRARNTTAPEVSYYLGLAYEALGKERQALNMLEAETRLPGLRSAAHLQLAEMAARRGDLHAAKVSLQAALLLSPDDQRIIEEKAAVLQALKDPAADQTLQQALQLFPDSLFLTHLAGHTDAKHLAADPYRVLSIATGYMRLGMYNAALNVLAREYPAVPSQQSEPGSVLPQQHPVVQYYRAYCEHQLDRPPSATLAKAAALSTRNVFPRGHFDEEVFRFAIQQNPEDANAHFLLGDELFSWGQTEQGMREWSRAGELQPAIPTLYASLGKAELAAHDDAQQAAQAFEKGRRHDAANPDVYDGLDQSLTLLRHPAAERIAILQSFPDPSKLPQNLIYELAMTETEAGQFDAAQKEFQNRFFSRGEGDVDVRQVWVEFRLQQALAMMRRHHCTQALQIVNTLGAPIAGFAVSENILPPMMQGARIAYLLGLVQAGCAQSAAAEASFTRAAKATQSDEVYWAYIASKRLGHGTFAQWHARIQNAEQSAQKQMSSLDASYWAYVNGLLLQLLGKPHDAQQSFDKALHASDLMLSYHLVRLAQAYSVP
jgi:tetratricopeptide (TPR) repeat protein